MLVFFSAARDLREATLEAVVEHQSINRIVTRLRSTAAFKTTVVITETKRFDGAVIQYDEFECGDDAFVLKIEPQMRGSIFNFRVTQYDRANNVISDYFHFDVEAVHTKPEMKKLLDHIERMIDPESMERGCFFRSCEPADISRCEKTNNGCFEHMRKQLSGNRASPLYGMLNIIFFSLRLSKNGLIPKTNYFGSVITAFPANKILNEGSVAFLAGMHCYCRHVTGEEWHSRAHYPSVIICQKDSATYHFCVTAGLKLLDWKTNNIIHWDKENNEIYCATKLRKLPGQYWAHEAHVEIMLADTTVRIEDGVQSSCRKIGSNCAHKSYLGCRACDVDSFMASMQSRS